jgi:uncharacterized protein with HEPN domain
MNDADRVRLHHMLDAGREVVSFIQGETRDSLAHDVRLVRAISMSIGIVGEAAAHVSDETRKTAPGIPWQQIIGMRNFLIHRYFGIDLDILWSTATQAIPTLIEETESLLSPDTRD